MNQEYKDNYDAAFALLIDFFEGNDEKAHCWMRTPNGLLGGYSPIKMIAVGNGDKLLRVIRIQLDGNKPPLRTGE